MIIIINNIIPKLNVQREKHKENILSVQCRRLCDNNIKFNTSINGCHNIAKMSRYSAHIMARIAASLVNLNNEQNSNLNSKQQITPFS